MIARIPDVAADRSEPDPSARSLVSLFVSVDRARAADHEARALADVARTEHREYTEALARSWARLGTPGHAADVAEVLDRLGHPALADLYRSTL